MHSHWQLTCRVAGCTARTVLRLSDNTTNVVTGLCNTCSSCPDLEPIEHVLMTKECERRTLCADEGFTLPVLFGGQHVGALLIIFLIIFAATGWAGIFGKILHLCVRHNVCCLLLRRRFLSNRLTRICNQTDVIQPGSDALHSASSQL